MKKYFILFFIVFISIDSLACDSCCCGAKFYYYGLIPEFSKNFVGMRYRHSAFESNLEGGNDGLFATQEVSQTTEIWGRFYPHRRVQLQASLPYQFNSQTEREITKNLSGLGDVAITANYSIFNTLYNTRTFKHSFAIGGGIKLATGIHKHNDINTVQVVNPNFQLGTGSNDFMLMSNYTLRYKKFGVSTDLMYKINRQNAENYRFGNRLSANLQSFYVKRMGNLGFMTNAGLYFENFAADLKNNYLLENTEGNLLATTVGMEIFSKSISMGVNFQQPIAQNLANGRIKSQSRMLLHLNFLF